MSPRVLTVSLQGHGDELRSLTTGGNIDVAPVFKEVQQDNAEKYSPVIVTLVPGKIGEQVLGKHFWTLEGEGWDWEQPACIYHG